MVCKEGGRPASEYKIEKNAIIYGRTSATHRGPTCGRNGYITPAFSGVPTWGQNQTWLRAQEWADGLHNPCLLGGPQ